ncbi:MAG: hypothetical protein LW807_07565 [Proteobacteria bacterium]|jgi:hypothetical protein|nr:hypothetical protein [Pseudomonadota bacterium]
MAQLKGDDLVLYAYENLEPIGCEDSFILNITANEIITTTKGSGRSTNREYGSYDWNIQCTGVITLNESGKVTSLHFNDNIIKGKKIAIKASVGDEFYFGIGIITNSANTGTSGEFAKFDVTIAGDGILYSTNNLKNTENEPTYLSYSSSSYAISYSSPLLLNATLLMVFVDDVYYAPDTYEFISNTGYGYGVITFDSALSSGKTVKLYYIP